MSAGGASEADAELLLSRSLDRFPTYPSLLAMASRLFQKAEGLYEKLVAEMETTQIRFRRHECRQAPSPLSTRRDVRNFSAPFRRFLLRQMLAAIEHRGHKALPSKLDSYLSFLDLIWIVGVAESNNDIKTQKTWHTFGLKEYKVFPSNLL